MEPAQNLQRNFLEDICKSLKQGEKVRKLLLDTKRKGEKIDQDIKRILLKREPFAEDSRSSSLKVVKTKPRPF